MSSSPSWGKYERSGMRFQQMLEKVQALHQQGYDAWWRMDSGFTWITAFLSALGKFFAWRSASSHSLMTYKRRKSFKTISYFFKYRFNELDHCVFFSTFDILNMKNMITFHSSLNNIWPLTKMYILYHSSTVNINVHLYMALWNKVVFLLFYYFQK